MVWIWKAGGSSTERGVTPGFVVDAVNVNLYLKELADAEVGSSMYAGRKYIAAHAAIPHCKLAGVAFSSFARLL